MPTPGSVDLFAVGVAVIAALLLFWFKWGVLTTLGICAVPGLVVA